MMMGFMKMLVCSRNYIDFKVRVREEGGQEGMAEGVRREDGEGEGDFWGFGREGRRRFERV